MRLLLTLLALLSGFGVSDRAAAAPALPAAMGAMVLLADGNGQVEAQRKQRRAPGTATERRNSSDAAQTSRKGAPLPMPGFLPGVDRALE